MTFEPRLLREETRQARALSSPSARGFRWKTPKTPSSHPHPSRLRFFSLCKALTNIICGHRLSIYYFTLHSERNAKITVQITTKIYACGRAETYDESTMMMLIMMMMTMMRFFLFTTQTNHNNNLQSATQVHVHKRFHPTYPWEACNNKRPGWQPSRLHKEAALLVLKRSEYSVKRLCETTRSIYIYIYIYIWRLVNGILHMARGVRRST